MLIHACCRRQTENDRRADSSDAGGHAPRSRGFLLSPIARDGVITMFASAHIDSLSCLRVAGEPASSLFSARGESFRCPMQGNLSCATSLKRAGRREAAFTAGYSTQWRSSCTCSGSRRVTTISDPRLDGESAEIPEVAAPLSSASRRMIRTVRCTLDSGHQTVIPLEGCRGSC